MAGIEKAQRRLRQARFFYEHLLNPRTSIKGNPEAFRFYFSAFIQTARTITWTIKTEEKKKWQEWEPKWRAERSNEEQKLLDLTNELRIIEEKKGGADLTVELEEVAVEALLEAVPPDRRLHTAFHRLSDADCLELRRR
jgi:hypothetical protein